MSAPRVSVDRIKAAVAAEFDVPLSEIMSDRRSRAVARPRQVAMALALELTPNASTSLGRLFRRDHSTVLQSRIRIAELRRRDPEFDARVRGVRARLLAPPPAEPIQLAMFDGPLFDWAYAA